MAAAVSPHVTSWKAVKWQFPSSRCSESTQKRRCTPRASVRRPALASRPDTGKQATSAPCRQIDRNGSGVPPPSRLALPRAGERDTAQRRPRGLSAVLDLQRLDDGAALACASRKVGESGEAAAREAPSPAIAVFAC
ncbi:hypothetical protein DFH09DRAFT_1085943 [Mycena vulgaris]|nr:hypothetical protein DFH09DRAFT_1085943 [Mycena vulgaris]